MYLLLNLASSKMALKVFSEWPKIKATIEMRSKSCSVLTFHSTYHLIYLPDGRETIITLNLCSIH